MNINRASAGEWPDQRPYRPFIKWSLIVALTLGFSAGAALLFVPVLGFERELWWLKHAQFHGQAQLFGFAGLFTMGVAHHVVPRFRRAVLPYPVPQQATLTLIVAGVFLRTFGQAMSARTAGPYLLYMSGIALLLGTLVFAATMIVTLRRGKSPRTPVEAWVALGTIWAVVAAGIHLAAVFDMASNHAPLIRGEWDLAFIYAALFGFLVNFIAGVSSRAVVGFLNLRPGYMRLRWTSMALINSGTALYVAARLRSAEPELIGMGALLIAAGLITLTVSLRILEQPAKRRPYIPPAYAHYEWFLRAAYGWLVIGALLLSLQGMERLLGDEILPVLSAAPVIHIFALGFITMMVFGLSARMVPLFEPAALPYHRSMDAAFILLNLAVIFRLAFGLGNSFGSDAGLALSGVLGLAALICFATPLFKTMRPAARARYAEVMAGLGPERLHQIQAYHASKSPKE